MPDRHARIHPKARTVPYRLLAECYRFIVAFAADPLAAALLLAAPIGLAVLLAVTWHHGTRALTARRVTADPVDLDNLEHLWRMPAAARSRRRPLRRRIGRQIRRRRAARTRI